MTQKQTPHHTPPLRFPEFRGAWEVKPLSDVIKVITPSKKLPTREYDKTGSFPIIDQSKSQISGWTDDKESIIDKGLPLIIFGDHTCVIKIAKDPFAQGADGIKIFGGSSDLTTEYLYQYLQLKPLESKEYKRHFSLLKEKKVFYPDKKSGEMQKITECLSSLDEVITAHSDKLDGLKDYKRGLMQQLFPAEGQTTPTLRFPEFKGKDLWQEKPLCKIADVIAGQSPEGSSYNKEGIGVPFYQGKTNFGDIYLKEPTTWTTQTTKLAQEGDILMSVRAPVGTLNISTGEVCIGRGVASIQAKQNKWYLYYFLKKNEKYIVGSGGSVFDSINKSQIEAIKILIPPTIEEQQKIADCLSAMDDLITAQKQIIKNMKHHKNGLMQRLFPTDPTK